jgi:hypothetical protein
LIGGHRDLRGRCTTDCLVTTITVTLCDRRDSTDVQYPLIWSARTASGADQLLRLIGMFCAAAVTSSVPAGDPFGNFPFGLIIKIPNGRLCLFSRRRVLLRMSAASLLSGGR